jgi:hypothetical protein
MSSYKSRAADQRVADDVVAGQELMCSATGCPHRWSVDAGSGRLCSWHAWSDPHLWPQITGEQLDAMADRARRNESRQYVEQKPLSRAEKIALLQSLREAIAPRKGRKDWAQRILDRVRDGFRVTPLVLKMARAVRGGDE